ncbi:uncharacterized protein LOC102701538 [Oryza brachyantha]|uniref:uncharacterized protein LOC102701538 n=1 Tax=Oryza brachyantha TaxID=4533 RepID=UPI001ADC8E85|nr:uncharacterized protein LOC102701538 [Oryza brachyantha]
MNKLVVCELSVFGIIDWAIRPQLYGWSDCWDTYGQTAEHLPSKIMSPARANLVVLVGMAFLFIGIVVGNAARGNNPGADFVLGRMNGHNPTANGANTHAISRDMNKGENSIAGHSSERKLAANTDGARTESLDWYCKFTGKKPCP